MELQDLIVMVVLEDHDKIKILEELFQRFNDRRKINDIYFNGQIFDAYSKILEIFSAARKELIIIDAYADNTLLNIVKRLNVNATIITKNKGLLTEQDIANYNKQYQNLKVLFDDTWHDRYFIIDSCTFYHCGTSINRIGHKTFSITLIGDSDVNDLLLCRINSVINDEKFVCS